MRIDDRLRADLPTIVGHSSPDTDAALTALLLRAGRRSRVRRAAYAVGLVAAAVVFAVTVGLGGGDVPRTMEPAKPGSELQILEDGRGSPGNPVPLAPGAYAIPFIGAPENVPWGRVEVPPGWGQDRLTLATRPDLDPHMRRVELLAVDWVATDPCLGGSSPARTVTDVLAALSGQRALEPSTARAVSVGGYTGQLVQFHVPQSFDVRTCSNQLLTPFGHGKTRTNVFPGWTYRTWVLDVQGHPLVVLAAHGPATTPTELTELTTLVEALRFVDPR